MNLRLIAALVLAVILILLFVSWGLIFQDWQQRFTESDLPRRLRRVRVFAAVVLSLLLTYVMVYWRLLASGIIGRGPGLYLIPLGAIVCLLGVIYVRGLWFLSRFRWLKPPSNRVSLQAGFVAFVSTWTAFDLKDVPDPAFAYLLVFALIAALVAFGSPFMKAVLGEDVQGLIGDLQESQPTIDAKTNRAVYALRDAARLAVELENSIRGRADKVNALRQESERYSEMVKVDAVAADALMGEVLSKIDKRAQRERWVHVGINILVGLGIGSLFFVIGLNWTSHIKGWLGI